MEIREESTSFKNFRNSISEKKLYTCKLVFLQTIHHSEEKWDHKGMMINNILLLLIFPFLIRGLPSPTQNFLRLFLCFHMFLCSANSPPPWPLLSGKPCLSLPWVSNTNDGAELTSQAGHL